MFSEINDQKLAHLLSNLITDDLFFDSRTVKFNFVIETQAVILSITCPPSYFINYKLPFAH